MSRNMVPTAVLASAAIVLALTVGGTVSDAQQFAPLAYKDCVKNLRAIKGFLAPEAPILPGTQTCNDVPANGNCQAIIDAGDKLSRANFNTLRLSGSKGDVSARQRACMADTFNGVAPPFGGAVASAQVYFDADLTALGNNGDQTLPRPGGKAYGNFIAAVPDVGTQNQAVYTIAQNVFLATSEDLNNEKLPDIPRDVTDKAAVTKFASDPAVRAQVAMFHGMNNEWQWWQYSKSNLKTHLTQYWKNYCSDGCDFTKNFFEQGAYKFTKDRVGDYLCCMTQQQIKG